LSITQRGGGKGGECGGGEEERVPHDLNRFLR